MKNNDKIEDLLLSSAKEAGKLFRENAFTIEDIEWKSETDPVTWLDRKAEEMIRSRLLSWNDISIMGEEFDDYNTDSPWKAYIDPLDGTKSYLRKEFNSACCIALEYDGKLHSGIVYDFMRDIVYMSINKKPCVIMGDKKYDFGRPLPLTPRISVESESRKYLKKTRLNEKEAMPLKLLDLSGSYALHMINVANGTIEGLVSHQGKGNPYDIAASLCIVESLGINTYNKYGESFDFKKPLESFMIFRPEYEKKLLPYFSVEHNQ